MLITVEISQEDLTNILLELKASNGSLRLEVNSCKWGCSNMAYPVELQ